MIYRPRLSIQIRASQGATRWIFSQRQTDENELPTGYRFDVESQVLVQSLGCLGEQSPV